MIDVLTFDVVAVHKIVSICASVMYVIAGIVCEHLFTVHVCCCYTVLFAKAASAQA